MEGQADESWLEITDLAVANIVCCTEEEGMMIGCLLEKCANWRVHTLRMWDEPHHHHHHEAGVGVGEQTWERLARAAARGTVRHVSTNRKVVRRGRREDLRAVWGITKVQWNRRINRRENPWILKSDGKKKGWRRIEKIISPLHKCCSALPESS